MFGTMRRKRRSTQMKSELNQSVDHFKRAAALAAQETSATVGPRYQAARGRVQPAAEKAKGAATSGWDSALATLAPLVAAAAENVKKTGDTVKKTGKETAKASKKATKADSKAAQKSAKQLEKRANKAISRRQSSGRGGKLARLALIGAAVGAGAAFYLRKRKAAQWDEYDPSAPITSTDQIGGADDAAFEPDATVTTATTGSTTTTTTTPSAGAVAAADPALGGTTTTDLGADSDSSLTTGEVKDQTSSELHSPNVARMASGQNKE